MGTISLKDEDKAIFVKRLIIQNSNAHEMQKQTVIIKY